YAENLARQFRHLPKMQHLSNVASIEIFLRVMGGLRQNFLRPAQRTDACGGGKALRFATFFSDHFNQGGTSR
ncbi:MAG TPA: hypothetical protein PKY22_03695, partial [Accumulibacter sp.]|nr:hypothetical protein [Accumulibacter sp.]